MNSNGNEIFDKIGSSSGIGEGIATYLASLGAQVVH
jgi:NAD(P)-dependent dehydrogenase (short-subunit alcohol dehydrogenase family)